MIRNEGYIIKDIIKRENGIVNINVYKPDASGGLDNENVTAIVADGQAVIQKTKAAGPQVGNSIVSQSSYGGVYSLSGMR